MMWRYKTEYKFCAEIFFLPEYIILVSFFLDNFFSKTCINKSHLAYKISVYIIKLQNHPELFHVSKNSTFYILSERAFSSPEN